MMNLFSIGEAAKAVNTTTETLRHYDRIHLVTPSYKEKRTNYRYYTKQDIVRLNTVRALQQMDLPLQKIKEVLEYDDIEKIIAFLDAAEKKANEKIAMIQASKAKILAAKQDYENKRQEQREVGRYEIKEYPQRIILLSDTLTTPTVDNLWNYLSHFYEQLSDELREEFEFENVAGVYRKAENAHLFAVCTRFSDVEGLEMLPAGRYVCALCTNENKMEITNELFQFAKNEYHVSPPFVVEQIVVSGILQWKYQIQMYLGEVKSNTLEGGD